ncbi:DUF6090 family protein [Rhodohalobacter mucosus]|uniref:Uncharacterized protein n=1 Tax=Rhodohalobacter mucosus TaxID=2079485 RepID=A0A316U2A1_9BACT|nr:DUF6090 family protein [Rhodohalobacter mucosus]PWN07286.1 hypothetical protein DDZ15_03190 [Rhodohalobacter mucosus]
MITLFRRVREKLIGEGNVRRYLLYAIGEIMLVVIGILIALQINTWQETQKLRALELETLTGIEQALKKDISVLDANLIKLNEKTGYARELINHIEQKRPYNERLDSLMMDVYYHRGYKTFNTAAFELLKERGFGIIKNAGLRNTITSHYTTDLSDINNILNRLESLNLLRGQDVYDNFKVYGDEEGNGFIGPYDYDELLENPRIFGPFYHFELIIKAYQNNLDDYKIKSEQVLNAVTAELLERGEQR